jgi:hypothetical protein
MIESEAFKKEKRTCLRRKKELFRGSAVFEKILLIRKERHSLPNPRSVTSAVFSGDFKTGCFKIT